MASHSARFWDRIAVKYARRPVPDEQIYQQKLAITQEYLKPDHRILEFGCGTGTTALHHGHRVADYLGLDVSQRMIELCRQKWQQQGQPASLRFEQGAIESLTGQQEAFDGVLAMSIFHLLDDPIATLQQVHQLLKPGGYLITSTVCLGTGFRIEKWILPLGFKLGLLPKVQFFDPQQWPNTIEAQGFRQLRYLAPSKASQAEFFVHQKI